MNKMHRDLKEFLECSDSFAGIVFKGLRSAPVDHVLTLFQYYSETGQNLLDDYNLLIDIKWQAEEDSEFYIVNDQNKDRLQESLSQIQNLGLFDANVCELISSRIEDEYETYCFYEGMEARRERAKSYLSNKDVRREVFKRYGKKCLRCKSKENICLDHITPISQGGDNEIENLQPLCKSCNSSKGTAKIDYRNYG